MLSSCVCILTALSASWLIRPTSLFSQRMRLITFYKLTLPRVYQTVLNDILNLSLFFLQLLANLLREISRVKKVVRVIIIGIHLCHQTSWSGCDRLGTIWYWLQSQKPCIELVRLYTTIAQYQQQIQQLPESSYRIENGLPYRNDWKIRNFISYKNIHIHYKELHEKS